jgi:aryl-alcohol dehydrogenase-like predicted oxidoreductase
MIVGKAIQKYKIPREKLVILTKCHALVNDEPYAERSEHGTPLNNTKEYINKFGTLALCVLD